MMRELTLKEMETVSAGTVGEMDEILSALVKNGVFRTAISVASHIPGLDQKVLQCVINSLAKMGIKAQFDLGFAGTGLGAGANKYYSMVDGRAMDHQEVLSAIGSHVNAAVV
ncbi:MAG: hypothetical protein IKP22_12235 [Clostridia bacterium]|nr:hypothetical protein [Clostridia bacterium]